MHRRATLGPHFILGQARPTGACRSTQTLGLMKYPIHLVQLEVKPVPGAASANEASGAYANIYIRAVNARAAVAQARNEVESAGWFVEEVTESNVVTAESFESEENLAYYKQCEIDGVVVVLHTWRDQQ